MDVKEIGLDVLVSRNGALDKGPSVFARPDDAYEELIAQFNQRMERARQAERARAEARAAIAAEKARRGGGTGE